MAAQILPATAENIDRAAQVLRDGGIVAFPTETVYGLAASALDDDAVAKIFAAKGRPSTNPIIVHVTDADAARSLAAPWTPLAERLAARFWPGPLTLVVKKAASVPSLVTAGGFTVGVRVPSHPVALSLLRACGLPLAAPSANRSEEVSPTTAQHVADSLGPFVDTLLILDGGPCSVGLESTVLDATVTPPHVLRPGMVTSAMISAAIDSTVSEGPTTNGEVARAPGQMTRHYAPRKPVVLCPSDLLPSEGAHGLLLHASALILRDKGPFFRARKTVAMPLEPEDYAQRLYSALHELDESDVSQIYIERPPDTPEWTAIHDRLRRAAAK